MMRVVLDRETYRNREYVLVDTTRLDAERWATENRPAGWRVERVAAVRGRPENFTVAYRKVA